jgi:hypothetical protein
MTKREAKQHKIEWNRAIAEGRAVRIGILPTTFRSFLTSEEAQSFVTEASQSGFTAEIINPELAQ